MHPYFSFKDLVTIFLFLLALSIIVCFYPNLLGQLWPTIMLLIENIIYICAISWKYILINYLVKIYNKTIVISDLLIDIKMIFLKRYIGLVPIYNLILVKKFIEYKVIIQVFLYISPNIVKYYYKIYNQQITKVIKFIINYILFKNKSYNDNKILAFIYRNHFYIKRGYNLENTNIKFKLLRVGISETIRTQK